MNMPERGFESDEHRFGFQNQETDKEFWGGAVSYKYRIHDPRLGRFFSVDPLAPEYPWNSVYAFSENRVMDGVELEGAERLSITIEQEAQLGNPGIASIAISKDHHVITKGPERVVKSDLLDPEEYHSHFERGNTTLFMSTLPSKNSEGTFLSSKNSKLAEQARENPEAAGRLRRKGISYYEVAVTYDYNLHINPDITPLEAIVMQGSDPYGIGMVRIPPETSPNQELGKMLRQFKRKKDSNPERSYFNTMNDYVFLNPSAYGEAPTYNWDKLTEDQNGNKVKSLNPTEVIVHGAGHNSAGAHKHGSSYSYKKPGLNSNIRGLVYPTISNTKNIINDELNRNSLPR